MERDNLNENTKKGKLVTCSMKIGVEQIHNKL